MRGIKMQFRRSVLLVLMIIFFIYFEIHSCSEDVPLAPRQEEPTADNLIYRAMDIHFSDRLTGWAIGYQGTLMKTTDGGENWEGVTVDSGDFRDIQFLDNNRGWLAGKDGAFYRTTDGCNWEPILSSGFPADEDFSNVWFQGDSLGFIQGLLGVYRTEDGGKEWNNYWLPFVPYKGAWDMSFVNDREGYLLGTQWMEQDPILLYRTIDGGLNWRAVFGSRSSVLVGVLTIAFLDEGVGWAGGGVIMKTTDGGQTWETQLDPAVVREFFFLDEQCGFGVGGSSVVKTVDGGASWIDISPGDERVRDLRSAYFFDVNTGWVIGLGHEVTEGSSVFQNSVLLETTDGGASWTIREYSFDVTRIVSENIESD
jgi:photosystem II stability/assembly factor-like uncharacterized protein